MRGILNRVSSRSGNRPSSTSLSIGNNNISDSNDKTTTYQQLPDSTPRPSSSSANNTSNNSAPKYKGFNTSITHIFHSPPSSQIDCCSLACCGILQSDYNKYILHNRRPPTFRNRCFMYILIPIFIFCTAGYAAVMIKDNALREVLVWTMLGLIVAWVRFCLFHF